jgi:hypothetical protein
MARRAEAEPIYAAADRWKQRCLVEEGSVFVPDGRLWTLKNVERFRAAFTGNPLLGSEDFLTKFRQQLGKERPEIMRLAAEMLWVLFLFPRKLILPARKRELVTGVWRWSGTEIPPEHPYLSNAVLAGIGSAGTAFNTQRDRELEGLIDVVAALKQQSSLLYGPWSVAEVVDAVPKAARRNIRNLVLHLLYPAEFERIASLNQKREIVKTFAEPANAPSRHARMPAIDIDRQLLVIRRRLEQQSPGKEIDFYDPELKRVWAPPEPADETKTKGAGRTQTPPDTTQLNERNAGPGVPLPGYDGPRLGDDALVGVWEANRLASAAGLEEPGPDLLFAAYMLLTGEHRYGSRSAMAIYQHMAEIMRVRRPSGDPGVEFILNAYGLPALPVFDEVPKTAPGPRVRRILASAEAVRSAVAGNKPYPIATRHVVAALVRPGSDSVVDVLEEHGLDPHAVRRVMLSSIESSPRGEDVAAWRRLLLQPETPLRAEAAPVYAGFSTDALAAGRDGGVTRDDDRLNVMSDVTALCEVLAALDTRPPIAVGLFGDWGTGKSFFMELMKNEIDFLGTQNPSFYCSRVVQVWFNAWHYMDTNLWASLASRVFEALAEQLEKWQEPRDLRQNLFEKLQESQGVLAEAVQQKADASARLDAITKERGEKRKSVTATAGIAFQAAVSALAADDEVQRKLRDAASQLGLADAQVQVDKAGAQAREARSLAGRAAAISRALRAKPIFLVVGLFVFGTVMVAANWAIAHWQLASGAARIVAQLAAALGALSLALAPVIRRVARAVHWLEDVHARLEQQVNTRRRQEELTLERDILRLDEREREIRAQVDALTRDIEEMRAGRRLERFIMERHTSAEYRQQLGIVSLIRNDFQQLSTLLSESTREHANASAGPAEGDAAAKPLPRIDRIILYIDDLDRCPEDRVVEVLQAVHLLLAFPLFVVVVGVDSRWLLLSLQDHYAALRGRSGEQGGGQVKTEPEWNTTPQNYLEKIFQIPFTLRPMASSGFGSLVDALLPLAEQQPGGPEQTGPTPGRDRTEAPEEEDDEIDLGDDDLEDEETNLDIGATPISLNPQGLTVEPWEREFIRALHPLVASPRALKRFTNIYRFLRVQQRGADLDRFRGTEAQPGEFQVAALLLAALVGYPAEATPLLRRLLMLPGASFADLVKESNTEPSDDPVAASDSSRQNPGHARQTLQQALLKVQRTVTIGTHAPGSFTRWAREVARFSFQAGRILSMWSPLDDPDVTARKSGGPNGHTLHS